MDSVHLTTPDDPGRAPIWENYIIAQVAQASLGLVPRHALALGVEVDRLDVTLRCQLSTLTDADTEDRDDIVDELEALVGEHVRITRTEEIRSEPLISPNDGVAWTYVARL